VSSALEVRPISRDEHERFIGSLPSASFLQCPSWGEVKSDWRAESIGWYEAAAAEGVQGRDRLVGAGLVLYRQVPRLKRYLAYLPEGPTIDWGDADLGRWLTPMVAHLKRQGAFAVKIGPRVEIRHWEAATVKQAIAEKTPSLRQTPPTGSTPTASASPRDCAAWAGARRKPARGSPQASRSTSSSSRSRAATTIRILKGFNQLWRRNVKKADKAGVKVTQGSYDDPRGFHDVYRETAERDGFHPRPLSVLPADVAGDEGPRTTTGSASTSRSTTGLLLAATTMVRVGTHAWYSYGASSNEGRDVRPSNAIQWRMMRDARDAGASVYDLRGITDTLDADDKLFGLIQFKVGTGGRAVEYLGEWDLPVNRPLSKAFDLYLARRG
jgi:lipid II:glycine glycyltransferase (peptidoglycan interpeptide bridge formation enzyme)